MEVGHGFSLDDVGSVLRVTLLGGPTFYVYDVFPLLDSINAFEITLSTGVTL